MASVSDLTPEVYDDYRAELDAERMTAHVRLGAMVALVLQTCFVVLDWYAYPEQFALFFGIRMALNLLLALIYFRTSVTHPVASEIALCLVMGAGMLALIYGADATQSGYYAGLILVFAGMGVMLPLTALQSAGICAVLLGAYAVAPLFSEGPVEWGVFGLHMVFLSAAACVSVASCTFLDRTRLRDFAQRRAIEEARDALKKLDVEKSRFTANVHHELRTPLTLMLAPLESMLGGEFGEVPERLHDYLRTMHSNALRLLKLINNLLDLAKIEGGQRKVVRRLLPVGRLVEDLMDGARPLAERRRIELRGRGLAELPEIHVDPDALEKVFVNLIGNALKFTEPEGRVEVSAEAMPHGVHFVVTDTGVGIPEDQLARVFDRFAQVDGSSTRRFEGTGIGLALVKELVELHDGSVWAESEGPGRGSAMHVVLPRGSADSVEGEDFVRDDEGRALSVQHSMASMQAELDADEEQVAPSLAAGAGAGEREASPEPGMPPPDPALQGAEVLICEDNADMRRMLAHFVGREFRVRTASNGREGFEALQERPPDLVLTDVMMPEMSGTELCRLVKSDPETAGIPVVLVTSKAEREMKIEGLELGADDYVTKPFHPRELMARVRGLLKLRRLQQQVSIQNARLESTNEELQATLGELREASVKLAQAERLSAVGELAAGVAHEINNPVNFAVNALRTLRSYVDEIQGVTARLATLRWDDRRALERELRELEKLRREIGLEDVTESLAELVDIVTEGLDRTHRLVGDLRDLAAPGEGWKPGVDLLRGLETTIQLVSHSLKEGGIRLETDLPGALPPLDCDPRALNQVFLNLLKNAAEALDGAGGTVRVSAGVADSAIEVKVADDGPGLDPELATRIFEPFFSTKGAGQGSGLGLSISRRIVDEHGGTLSVSSEPGQGTTFTLSLPVERREHAPEA